MTLPREPVDRPPASGSPGRGRLADGRLGRDWPGRDWLGLDRIAVAAGLAAPLALAAILIPFRTSFANAAAALALILVVVAVAALGRRLAGYVAAISAAAWFDFFLTRPYEQFRINRAHDIETTILLLLVGVAVTEIAVWGRRQHAAASRRAGYLAGINDAAHAVATGGSPSALIDQIASSLTQLLSLRSCQFQYGVAGIGRPARILHNGDIFLDGRRIVAGEAGPQSGDGPQAGDGPPAAAGPQAGGGLLAGTGLPAGTGLELLVESGGRLQGRFLMQPAPDARPSREQLLVAVALADQVGAALASSYPAQA